MVVDFSKIDLSERPVLILKNVTGVPIGVLGYATNITADIKYDETSTIEFDIPAGVDNEPTPHYDSVIGMRIVELQDVGQFVLINPKETGDGVKKIKSCTGYSLEYEFTFKKITLESATYNFWNPTTPDSTLLGIILEMMPSWSVGDVDEGLVGKYRTFEISDENLYNFIKGTIQNSYNCIFDFDTFNRKINVKDASSSVPTSPIYISNSNLASEITVEEDTESIVTRLDVNGADGVDIRDVNPSGTNQIINLDYFMTTDNFDQTLIDKYYAWKESYENYRLPYYNLSVEYVLQVMRKATEQAALVELESERTVLENEQAVIIQSIARDLLPQSKLDDVNARIAAKQAEIDEKNKEIENVQTQADSIYSELTAINRAANFKSYFTDGEYIQLDRYLKDDSVSESSFVAQTTDSYTDSDVGSKISGKKINISDANISYVVNSSSKEIFDVTGGKIKSDFVDAEIIRAAFEKSSNGSFIMTAYLGEGKTGERTFPKGCISLTGTVSSVEHDMKADEETPSMSTGSKLGVIVEEAYLYFTQNTSEYEKRAVAWDLLDYGNEILTKISQPSYTFSVTSADFLSLEDFVEFKNKLRHGEKLYVGISEDETLEPICIGVNINFDSPSDLTLEFSDTYTSGDSSFLLADLLEQSVSMGKSVDLSKYTYSAFMDSGASTKVKDFMSTALDVSKNAIMSSKEQAISWGDSGIRLRKWADNAHTTYDPKQVWLNNNSILMTGNNWATAEIAIGNFYDKNLGDCWGVVAPNLVGTLIAGSNLVIESAKEDGGVAVFKVDAEGCTLHNSNLSVTNEDTNTQILLDPMHGLMIGKYPLVDNEGNVNDDNKLFYADTEGNLTLKGKIYATDGSFSGNITALSGYIGQPSEGWTIGSSSIYNGKKSFSDTTAGVYMGTDGISLGEGANYIRANKNGYLLANNVNISGHIEANSGTIGGCEIADGVLQVGDANITNLNASKLTSGTISANMISGGTIDASDVTIKNLNASNITAGTLDCSNLNISNLRADSISVGKINADQLNGLPASQITSGSFDTARIPGLSCSKIVSGTFDPVRIPDLSADKITTGSLSADRIKGGTLQGTAINIGGSQFTVSTSGNVYFGTGALNVYGHGRYYTGQTFTMTFVRNVSAAVVVSKIELTYVQGLCVGWSSV